MVIKGEGSQFKGSQLIKFTTEVTEENPHQA